MREGDDRTDLAVVGLADLRNRNDSLDAVQRAVERGLVLSEDVHDALVVHLRDGDGRARSLLDVLNHLAAGAITAPIMSCGMVI